MYLIQGLDRPAEPLLANKTRIHLEPCGGTKHLLNKLLWARAPTIQCFFYFLPDVKKNDSRLARCEIIPKNNPGFGLFRILIQKILLLFRKYFGPSDENFHLKKNRKQYFYIWMWKKHCIVHTLFSAARQRSGNGQTWPRWIGFVLSPNRLMAGANGSKYARSIW